MSEYDFIKRIALRYPSRILLLVLNEGLGGFLVLVGIGGIVTLLVTLFSETSSGAGLTGPLGGLFDFLGLRYANATTLLGFLLLIYFLQLVLDGIRQFLAATTGVGLLTDIRKEMNDALTRTNWVSFAKIDQGKYMNNLVAESSLARGAVNDLSAMIASGLVTLVYMVWLLIFSPSTALIFAGIAIVSLLASRPLLRLSRHFSEKRISVMKTMSNVMNDTRHLFKMLFVENLVGKRVDIMNELIEESSRVETRNSMYSILSNQYVKMTPILVIIMVSYYYLNFLGGSGADLAFNLLILQQIGTNFSSFQSKRQSMISKIPSYESCLEMIEMIEPASSTNLGKLNINLLGTGIRLTNVTYHYPDSVVGIRNVNAQLPGSGLVFIIGRSGSGKTTLVDAILGLIRPQEGHVLIDGQELSIIDPQNYSQLVSYLPQQAYLFQGTLRENLSFGSENVEDETIYKALDAADCRELVDALPSRLDTEVSPGGLNFSGGEKHRLALARALIRQAKILVLDEPSAGLDPRSEQTILRSLKKLSEQILVIIISHSQEIIQGMDNLLLMNEGTCIWQGDYTEFKGNPEFMRLLREV